MNKMVAIVFKTIAITVIMLVICDLCFFIFKAYALNQRIESIMVTMQQEVSKNNYLPEDTYSMYEGMLKDLITQFNTGGSEFIRGININYSHNCDFNPDLSSGLTFSKKLNTPADYGDIAVIEIKVSINAATWYIDSSKDNTLDQYNRRIVTKDLTYTYQVPCLRYINVTD